MCFSERFSKLVEELAEIVSRIRLLDVRPEEECEMRTRLRRLRMQHQISEQGLKARTGELPQRRAIERGAKLTEKAYVKLRRGHFFEFERPAKPLALPADSTA